MRLNKLVFLALVAGLGLGGAPSAKAVTLAWDFIWSNGSTSIDWGEGRWTRDGAVIGTTFPGGVGTATGNPEHLSDHIVLPQAPNDFHFTVDFPALPNTPHLEVWLAWNGTVPFGFTFDLFLVDGFFETMVDIDLVADSIAVSDTAGGVLFNGTFSAFDGTQITGLMFTGDSRMVMAVPEPMALVLVAIGLAVMSIVGLPSSVRRRR